MQEEQIMSRLVQYMQARAKFEDAAFDGIANVRWELTEKDLLIYFNKGIRNFFGVVIDDAGNLIEDAEQPSFFLSYKTASIN